jgi:hypothetical protein|tara:strand:- start:399 stop:593 length:195 start_codon:yes stop_codon:yes gene_type:complete
MRQKSFLKAWSGLDLGYRDLNLNQTGYFRKRSNVPKHGTGRVIQRLKPFGKAMRRFSAPVSGRS